MLRLTELSRGRRLRTEVQVEREAIEDEPAATELARWNPNAFTPAPGSECLDGEPEIDRGVLGIHEPLRRWPLFEDFRNALRQRLQQVRREGDGDGGVHASNSRSE